MTINDRRLDFLSYFKAGRLQNQYVDNVSCFLYKTTNEVPMVYCEEGNIT